MKPHRCWGSSSQPVGHYPFGRSSNIFIKGHLRPSENTDTYATIHNDRKFTVMEQ